MYDWDQEITPSERDSLVDKLAERVTRYRLTVPAILMLEMHKPLAFFAGQSIVLGSGFLAPLFGPQNVRQYARLFESRENIERLIQRIEEMQASTEPAADR